MEFGEESRRELWCKEFAFSLKTFDVMLKYTSRDGQEWNKYKGAKYRNLNSGGAETLVWQLETVKLRDSE